MLRFLRPRGSILSASRLPLRLEARRQEAHTEQIRRVRFLKRFRMRSVFLTAIVTYTSFTLYNNSVLAPLANALDEAADGLPALPDEEEEKPFFIPFPGTTKVVKPLPYRGSDPEWQEYIKFSKDPNLQKRIRVDLAARVLAAAENNVILTSRCGKGMKVRKFWLDTHIPSHPPPEYERSGIEIGDNFIAWSTMPVDSLTVFRLKQTLWPSAMALSSWNFVKVLVADDAKRIAIMLGIRPHPPSIPTMDKFINHQFMEVGGLGKFGPPINSSQPSDGKKTMVPTPQGTPDSNAPQTKPSELQLSELTRLYLSRPFTAFKAKFFQVYKPLRDYPPRGSIVVTGLVELESPRAYLVMEVDAAWNPKTNKYDSRSMAMKLKSVSPKKQGPLRK